MATLTVELDDELLARIDALRDKMTREHFWRLMLVPVVMSAIEAEVTSIEYSDARGALEFERNRRKPKTKRGLGRDYVDWVWSLGLS